MKTFNFRTKLFIRILQIFGRNSDAWRAKRKSWLYFFVFENTLFRKRRQTAAKVLNATRHRFLFQRFLKRVDLICSTTFTVLRPKPLKAFGEQIKPS